MGQYMYRVTAKVVTLADGRKAHVAKYAYKPYGGFYYAKENAQMHFQSGCVASEKLNLKTDLITTYDPEHPTDTGTLYDNKRGFRVFLDDSTFGIPDRLPRVGTVKNVDGKLIVEEK